MDSASAPRSTCQTVSAQQGFRQQPNANFAVGLKREEGEAATLLHAVDFM